MSENKKPSTDPTSRPIFVPKQEGQVALSLNEAIARAVEKQKERAELIKEIDNLKKVAKDLMKAQGIDKHETPEGHKAAWSERQLPKYNRDAIFTLTGDDFDQCVKYSTVKSFTIK